MQLTRFGLSAPIERWRQRKLGAPAHSAHAEVKRAAAHANKLQGSVMAVIVADVAGAESSLGAQSFLIRKEEHSQ